jgi:hypothetical protein
MGGDVVTNTIGLAKEQVKSLLEAGGIKAFDYIPERIPTNSVVIAAGDPFIEPGDLFGHQVIRLELTTIANQATNITSTDNVEALICDTFIALNNSWRLERVSQPFQLAANNATYLAARVEVSADIKIEMEE